MWPNFINMLNWWQWTILGLVPPAIIALYFLKLKRYPLEVPSTYLWHRSIEDIHVNTIWQKLRRNLLLFLQLLLILLAILAVLRPGWKGDELTGHRFIFMIDNSASMQATDTNASRLDEAKRAADTKTSRLDEAKRAAARVIDLMKPGDVAMLVSFADTARIEQMFTENRGLLRRGLEEIEPTQRSTSLIEAFKVASGLANPGRSADPESMVDVQVAEAMPATLYIFSDGKFETTTEALGNLDPVYKPIGDPEASNVGVVIFSVRRNEAKPDQLQAFARLQNFGSRSASVDLELWLDGQLIDAAEFEIGGGETQGFQRNLELVDTGVLNLRVNTGDDLALDDQAWTVINSPRRARVLMVTPGNESLTLALATDAAARLADVSVKTPDFLTKEDGPYRQQAAIGTYDLVIYDRCGPSEMPQANTLFIGAIPPIKIERTTAEDTDDPNEDELLWKCGDPVGGPQITPADIDPAHPLTQWIDMSDVLIARATPPVRSREEVPPGGRVLIDSHLGPMLVVAPREEYEDVVLGFSLEDEEIDGAGSVRRYPNTTWPARTSFPTFILNVLHYLGGARTVSGTASVRPGQPVVLQSPAVQKPLVVNTPGGRKIALPKTKLGKFNFTGTGELGVYEVLLDGQPLEKFAVNLFHPLESDIRPRKDIEVGRVPVEGRGRDKETARRELWKLFLLIGLAVLLFEWYVFHRRVYL